MRYSLLAVWVVGVLFGSVAASDDDTDTAIKKDRQHIQGTWEVASLIIYGNKANDEDIKQITVVNGDDGTWSVRSAGKVISKGVSTIDPTKKLKTIDFTPTDGGAKDDKFLGIYQLQKTTRKLCFAAAGKDRPTEFSSTQENHQVLVTFRRSTAK